MGQRIKREDIPNLSFIEKHTDVLNRKGLSSRKLDHLQPDISGRWGSVTMNRTESVLTYSCNVSYGVNMDAFKRAYTL